MPTLNEINKEKASRNLADFTKQSWNVIEPYDYLHNWHIDAISEYLTATTTGEIKRLLINIPPRYMKSTLVSINFPAWMWINNPQSRWIFASYAQKLSNDLSIKRRNLLDSNWYQENWSDRFKFSEVQNTIQEYANDKSGVMFSTSIGGTVTGKGGDYIIVDDPINPQDAHSEVERASAVEFFKSSLSSRLNNKKTGVIIVVMQRVHEDDVSGHILEQGGWEHLCLPAVTEKKTIVHFPISDREIIREEGSLLWEEREGHTEIEAVKKDLGSYGFSGQYQQDPAPAEGGLIKKDWWQYYDILPHKFDEVIQSWDCTFKETKDSDFVVGQVWGRIGADKYLIDQVRARMDIVKTIDAIAKMTKKYPQARVKLIEDKANGSAVISMLRKKVGGLIPVNPKGSKEARLHSVIPFIESGNVYLPRKASWVEDYVMEFAKFPKGKNDDQIDCTTQALDRLSKGAIKRMQEDLSGKFYTPTELEDMGMKKYEIKKVK